MEDFRISASQINLFLNEPALWVLNKFHKIYGDMGPAAWRGKAVEKGLEAVIVHDKSFDEALAWAHNIFHEDAVSYTGDTAEEHGIIEPMLKQSLELFLEMGKPLNIQIKVEGKIEGANILGYADFEYADFFTDLKTTKRCPSCADNISSEHMRQLSIYKTLTGRKQKIAYVTDKKFAIYEPSDLQYATAEREIKYAIRAMRAAWDMNSDVVAMLYPPRSFANFYWDEKTIKAANEVWK